MLNILFILCIFMLVFHYTTRKYVNPYSLIVMFGKKGAGKSTTLCKEAMRHLKKGWTVYSTVPIAGCTLFDVSEFGHRVFPEKSLVLVEEAGMVWDSREFKTFDREVRDYLRMQRHYKNKVLMLSQSFDLDKRIRDMADELYLCSNFARVFTLRRRIHKRVTISNGGTNGSGVSQLIEEYRFESPLFGGWSLTFIPRYIAYFKTHEHEDKPYVNGRYIEYSEIQKEYTSTRKWLIAQMKIMFIRAVAGIKKMIRKAE